MTTTLNPHLGTACERPWTEGHMRGVRAAKLARGDDEGKVTENAFIDEEHSRSYDLFALAAQAFDGVDDADGAWAAFDDGLSAGIADTVRARFARRRGGA